MSNDNISELTYHINSYSNGIKKELKGINYTHKGLGLALYTFLKIGDCAWACN